MMERRLDQTRLCALLIDAAPFQGQQMVAALGIAQDRRKTILGIRQGATENATVVSELLSDLVSRGLDFTEPRLYILDGLAGPPRLLDAAGEQEDVRPLFA
jgi:transposase-like protein